LGRRGTARAGVDVTATSGSVSLEPVTAVSAARPRCKLWRTLGGRHRGHGNRGGTNRAAIALAESIRRKASGLNSAGMPGSYRCVEPEVVTPDSAKLFCLLRALAHAPGVGQGRSEEHTSELQSHLNLVC